MLSAIICAATLVVKPPEIEMAVSAVLKNDVKFSDLETLTPKSRAGKTRFAGHGSGFCVSVDGWILTNHHVVENAEELVAIYEGTAYAVSVVKSDADLDLALLRPKDITVELDKGIDFSTYKKPEFMIIGVMEPAVCNVGDTVYVVGYPSIALQGMDAKVTKGIVSSLSGYKGQNKEFQMDAAIQPGNSGGPVVDERGSLVGVSVATLRGGQNVNYAIKLDEIKQFLSGQISISSVRCQSRRDEMIREVMRASVLVLNYESGSRPLRFADETQDVRVRNEARANFEKTILYAKLLKLRHEWNDLKELTDSLIKEYGDNAPEIVKELNSLAKKNLETETSATETNNKE